jgi:parallel beta-helix repeat protein
MKSYKLLVYFITILLFGAIFLQVTPAIQIKSEMLEFTDTNGEVINLEPLENLPSYFCWQSADIDDDGNGIPGDTDFTTPVRNQAPFPSCETFALTAAVETMVQIKVGYPFGCDLSEAHLFFFSGGTIDWGSYPENDTKFLKEYGIPDESCWPYPNILYQYPKNTTSPDWQNRTVKISDWYYLPENKEAIKTALITNGPVPTYFIVYEDFIHHENGIYRHKWGKVRGPHYVCIVGYNDDPGYWIVKNSWGKGYQEDGWFKIKYGECSIEKKSFYLTGVYGQFPLAYVDDDNTAGPWNGSKEYPYQTIQQAINNVYPGYTIYVMNGTYYENIIVNKTVNIDGEDNSITIIDGGSTGDVVTISEPGVRISGFTVQNSGNLFFNAGIKTLNLKSNTVICDNIIQNNDIGLFLNYAYEDASNAVKNNIIKNNREGIYVHWANNNEISGNTIYMNSEAGLIMERCEFSVISNNIISDNNEYGIYLRSASKNNLISGKNIIKNNGIGIKISESNKNCIFDNNFISNSKQAYIYNSFLTKWKRNFWDDWQRILPKIIKGHIGQICMPYFNIDWCPRRNI